MPSRRTCVLCGRYGTSGFVHDETSGRARCQSARACVKRWRAKLAAAKEDPEWRRLQAEAITRSHPAKSRGIAHACSAGYATEALAEYDLDDWDWLVAELANEMDDAAFDAADEWFTLNRESLRTACHLPRWCPCGRWPDFGVGCYYHGACECVTTKVASADLMTCFYVDVQLAYSAVSWRMDVDYGKVPVLGRGCPVHPNGPLPDDVYARWRVHAGLSLHPAPGDFAGRQAQERRRRGEA